MDKDIQNLILAQLEEIAKIVRDVDSRLTRLETSTDIETTHKHKFDEAVQKNLRGIENRLTNLENFRMKLVIGAALLAVSATIIWEVLSPVVHGFFT